MTELPGSEDSLLVRTDFDDEAAWERARAAAVAVNEDEFCAYVSVVDDRAWDGVDWEELRRAAVASGTHAEVLFRCIASRLWSVDNNLNISNMDWEEFAEETDSAGVFRGF